MLRSIRRGSLITRSHPVARSAPKRQLRSGGRTPARARQTTGADCTGVCRTHTGWNTPEQVYPCNDNCGCEHLEAPGVIVVDGCNLQPGAGTS